MSTNHGAHGLFGWLSQILGHRVQPPSSCWERYPSEQHTDEVPLPRQQNTDGIRYPLHQHEQPVLPDQSDPENRLHKWPQWYAQQPELCPRLIEETGPKKREQLGRIQEIHPQIVAWQPSPIRSPRTNQESAPIASVVAPNTPIPDAADTRSFDPINLPAFLRATIPGRTQDPLPVQRLTSEPPLVRKLDPTSNILDTMRPRRRYELEKPPISDLPTVPDANGLVRAYVDALPPWHPLPPPSAPPSGWLNDNQPGIELWPEPDVPSDPEPTTEDNIPTRKLEPVQLPTCGKSATLARVDPGLWQLQQWAKHKKESE